MPLRGIVGRGAGWASGSEKGRSIGGLSSSKVGSSIIVSSQCSNSFHEKAVINMRATYEAEVIRMGDAIESRDLRDTFAICNISILSDMLVTPC